MATSATVEQVPFYTYFHTRNDTGLVFYVGKGCGNRLHSFDKRNARWRSTVKKHGYHAHVAAIWPTEQEAFEHEKFLIKCFKDLKHPITNMTDGGEGTSGWIPNEVNKANIGAAAKRRWDDPAYKQRLSEIFLRAAKVEGYQERRGAAVKLAHYRPEVKARLVAGLKKLWTDPAYREKVLASRLANKESLEQKAARLAKSKATKNLPENKLKTSTQVIARWADKDYRDRTVIRMKNSMSELNRTKQSARMKGLWKDASYVEKVASARELSIANETFGERSARMKKVWERPEIIEKMKRAALTRRSAESRLIQSLKMKALWESPEYLLNMKNRGIKK